MERRVESGLRPQVRRLVIMPALQTTAFLSKLPGINAQIMPGLVIITFCSVF